MSVHHTTAESLGLAQAMSKEVKHNSNAVSKCLVLTVSPDFRQ